MIEQTIRGGKTSMLDTTALNQLLLDGFSGKITWLEASTHYSLEEFIEAFKHTRDLMQKNIAELTDAQVRFVIIGNPTWSISEMVTHLIYSQAAYHNFLLDITGSELPHITEAAKGFGEGAKEGIPAGELRENLAKATVQIYEAIELTRAKNDPSNITSNPLFGRCNYQTWILLLLGHEVDHVRQGVVMRRAARVAMPNQ
jgi:DinB superfamily